MFHSSYVCQTMGMLYMLKMKQSLIYLNFVIGIAFSAIHVDDENLPAEFSIQIKEASTEVWMDETTYQVEFETRYELKSKVAWFLHRMNQKYPVVFGDPNFSSSMSYRWPYKNRYIARLRAREHIDTLEKKTIEFAVSLDQSTVMITFDELRNKNTTTSQTFDLEPMFKVSVHNKTEMNETTYIEYEAGYDVRGSGAEDQQLVMSRYIVKKSNDSDENEVEFISKSIKNIPSDEILFFDWEYNNAALFVDVTEIKMSYGPAEVIKTMVLRTENHFWNGDQMKPLYGKAFFQEYDIIKDDQRPIKIAHCEAIGDVIISIGLRGKNGMADIPSHQIPAVQVNYGYFREAFVLLRYYRGKLGDYEAYCSLQ